jgi:hypothetical protein
MAFFQNVFDQEYQGYLLLSDRKLIPTFKVAPNRNLQSQQVAWNPGPYDFSSTNLLVLNFCWDKEFKNWASLSIDVAGSNASSTKPAEAASILNADPTFSNMFVASVTSVNGGETVSIASNPKRKQNVRFYFSNSGAETKLRFNKMAGVAELPEYFSRHTISNRNNYEDSAGMLIKLDTSDAVDQNIIEEAGFVVAEMQADWQLLRGRASGLFTFQKLTVDSSDRITEIIEYPAGSVVGDFARKISYVYSGAKTNPSQITEIPYVLTSGDLVTP